MPPDALLEIFVAELVRKVERLTPPPFVKQRGQVWKEGGREGREGGREGEVENRRYKKGDNEKQQNENADAALALLPPLLPSLPSSLPPSF
jgi:hypothetical protein